MLTLNLAATPPSVLGQVASTHARIDGTEVPSGTTLFSGNVVSAVLSSVTVHLGMGQVIELGRNSEAAFQRTELGEVRVEVRSGTLSYLEPSGSVNTLPPDSAVTFSQLRTGEPISDQPTGVVAVVEPVIGRDRAEKGQDLIGVNDVSRVEPSGSLLIRARSRLYQEMKCSIDAVYAPDETHVSVPVVRHNTIDVSDPLNFDYFENDWVIQRLRVEEHKPYTTLDQSADDGDEELHVKDSKVINPLERVLVRSLDGRRREVACVEWTEEKIRDNDPNQVESSVIRIASGLKHEYEEEAEVWQGLNVSDEELVTTLREDADDGQKTLRVMDPSRIDPLQQLMIRTPDGKRFEAYCIYSIEDDRVELAEDLDFEYPEGSMIVQGRSAQDLIAQGVALQRAANCCCCCDGAAFVPVFAWWPWAVVGGGAAGAAGVIGSGGGSGGDDEIPPSEIVIIITSRPPDR